MHYVVGKRVSGIYSQSLYSIENQSNFKEQENLIKPRVTKNGLMSVFLIVGNILRRIKGDSFLELLNFEESELVEIDE